ncbi:hypothetical protein [Sediminispirochaeta bajacaliforniensis]|uniref:hypothetical protein n=1 Tax=Sediminispirochaeta bajacaliforniensis TaxID=148 RepID=UPI00037BDA90|nr:hypothetical protein [Sediminispirochaeta bajacaliforniensis]
MVRKNYLFFLIIPLLVIIGCKNPTGNDTDTAESLWYKVSAANGSTEDMFGFSVDIEGDYAVVGARGYDHYAGTAYVFHKTGPNSWDNGTQLEFTGFDNGFGWSVSISGDYVLVGCRYGNHNIGEAYIYQRTGTNSWGNRQVLNPSDATSKINFGLSVSLDGDYAAIGTYTGESVYVYKKGSNGWSNPSETILKSTKSRAEKFGYSISLDGDTLAIGAYENDLVGAYVYERYGDNAWGNIYVIAVPEKSNNRDFGISVAVDDGYLIVGDTAFGDQGQGAAFVYERSSGGNIWEKPAKLTAPDGAPGDNFGTVAISGDTILVGAENAVIGGNSSQGAVYRYSRTGSNTWDFAKKLADSNGSEKDYYYKAALDNTALIIGAWGAENYKGSASIYRYK